MTDQIASIGYTLAGIVFLALAGLLLTHWRGRLHGIFLPIAAIASVGWAMFLAQVTPGTSFPIVDVFFAEIIFNGAWLLMLSQLLASASGTNWLRLFRYSNLLLVMAVIVSGLGNHYFGLLSDLFPGQGSIMVGGLLLISLVGLVGTEQIFRNARKSQRSALKFLCLGVAVIFAYNLFLYTNTIVGGQISNMFWGVRGFIVAMSVPLISIAVYRSPIWTRGIFVSRQIVFYSTILIGAVGYLTAIGFAGYYIGIIGGTWGQAAQLVFFCAALLIFLVLLLSDRTRAKVRVFLSKHFLESKYDYREEWLRLIDTLTGHQDGLPLKKCAVKSLAQIVGSTSGLLWMRQEDAAGFECVSGWNQPEVSGVLSDGDSLPRFLDETRWVIDLDDLAQNPGRYVNLELNDEELAITGSGIVIPLIHEQNLFGLVILSKPRTPFTPDFEDHDLLKTVGQQIASYLAQERATERLAEVRQFEAFNKLTAFIMHDLKNALAQQSLVVENAERHKRNPDFVDDAIDTIKGSVARLRRILEHLQQRKPDVITQKVELKDLTRRAIRQCEDRLPVPQGTLGDTEIWVTANPERLSSAIQHAIRNAQDATPDDGDVKVVLQSNGTACTIIVADTGAGMDETFIRERLFRPFDSTKGTQGMGIGAYQVRETIRASGGDVMIESTPGVGTKIRLNIPVCQIKRVSK